MNGLGEIVFSVIIFINITQVTFDKVLVGANLFQNLLVYTRMKK